MLGGTVYTMITIISVDASLDIVIINVTVTPSQASLKATPQDIERFKFCHVIRLYVSVRFSPYLSVPFLPSLGAERSDMSNIGKAPAIQALPHFTCYQGHCND